MNAVAMIIERFGGVRKLASLAGVVPGTVHHWKKTGFIPAERQRDVLDLGRALDPPLRPEDFFRNAAE